MPRLLGLWFFFSSRRRHTRFDCDWSSDVCSSDLLVIAGEPEVMERAISRLRSRLRLRPIDPRAHDLHDDMPGLPLLASRSEERRVGKEGRPPLIADPYQIKKNTG